MIPKNWISLLLIFLFIGQTVLSSFVLYLYFISESGRTTIKENPQHSIQHDIVEQKHDKWIIVRSVQKPTNATKRLASLKGED